MTRLGRLELTLLLILGVALVASVSVILRQSWRLAALERQQAAELQSLHKLQATLRQPEPAKTAAEAESPAPAGAYQATLAKNDVTIERLNRELGEAQANIKDLQAQLSSSNDEREKALASANELHQKEKEDWQSQLDALKQQLDSAQAESEASRQRLAALEADNAKLKSDNSAASARLAEFSRAIADLQDLDRRRDAYLTSIMRRYRDITSQFRAISGMLDSSRDAKSNPLSDAALTRIQNDVSLADDDLRQLTELNAQASKLEKKLAKK